MLTILLISLALWAVALVLLLVFGKRFAVKQAAKVLPDVVRLLKGVITDRRVPLVPKVVLGGGLLYLINPIDLIPEFLPVIGPLDDIVVIALTIRYLLKRCPPDVLHDHWRGEPETLVRLTKPWKPITRRVRRQATRALASPDLEDRPGSASS